MLHSPQVERSVNGGVQKIFVFPNGYGASVIRHPFSYGGADDLWELAVVKFEDPSNPHRFRLTYDTPITDDVIGHLSDMEVEILLDRIKLLGGGVSGD